MSDSSFESPPRAQLLAIVSVQPEDRVLCAQPNCGHSVFAQIHVVQEGEKLLVLGSTCYGKRYGGAAALGAPRHGGTGGRPLTAAERQLLANNTAALLAQFEQERTAALEASLTAEAARQADREAQHQAALEKHRILAATVPERRAPPAPALLRTPALPEALLVSYVLRNAGWNQLDACDPCRRKLSPRSLAHVRSLG